MYDLVIVGAGPGGIALAAEARACNVDRKQVLVLEKGAQHNWAIRQFYPAKKLTTANYKGFEARCEGLLCIHDMTKGETLEYFDRVIRDYDVDILYNTDVFTANRVSSGADAHFRVEALFGVLLTYGFWPYSAIFLCWLVPFWLVRAWKCFREQTEGGISKFPPLCREDWRVARSKLKKGKR